MITTPDPVLASSKDDLVDHVLAALQMAKKAHALLPPLPAGLRPVHIRILNALHELRATGGVRVSDINSALGAAFPNTTRFVNELVALHVLRKVSDETDKRVVRVQTTELGEQYTERYVISLHTQLAEAFSKIGASDCYAMINTLGKVHAAMTGICMDRDSANAEELPRGSGQTSISRDGASSQNNVEHS